MQLFYFKIEVWFKCLLLFFYLASHSAADHQSCFRVPLNKSLTCKCNLAAQSNTEADERKKPPPLSHTQVLCILHLTPKADWQPTAKRLVFVKKVTFESLLVILLDTKTSNITSYLLPLFLASVLCARHMFLWSFRALLARLSTMTSAGACR